MPENRVANIGELERVRNAIPQKKFKLQPQHNGLSKNKDYHKPAQAKEELSEMRQTPSIHQERLAEIGIRKKQSEPQKLQARKSNVLQFDPRKNRRIENLRRKRKWL